MKLNFETEQQVLFETFLLGSWMTFKKAEMEKPLNNEWNGLPQPQMVGFRDLVGVGIAPVSKKTAVKWDFSHLFLYFLGLMDKCRSYKHGVSYLESFFKSKKIKQGPWTRVLICGAFMN